MISMSVGGKIMLVRSESIKDAEKDKPEICFTEGYLLKKIKIVISLLCFFGDEIVMK